MANGILAAILSFFIPGLGQAIEGYKTRGIILFAIALIIAGALIYFNIDKIVQYIVMGIYGLISTYDAYRLY